MRPFPQPNQPQPQSTYSFSTLVSFGACCLLGLLLARSVDEIIFEGISVDVPRYYKWYVTAEAWPFLDYLGYLRFEPGYSAVTWVLSNLGITFDTFIIISKISLIAAYFYFMKRILGYNLMVFLCSSVFIVSPVFSGYTENTLRQAMAYSVFILAYAQLLKGNHKVFYIFSALAALMHFSSVLWSLIVLVASQPFVYRRFKTIALSSFIIIAIYIMDVPLRLTPYIQAFGNLVGIGYVNIGGNLAPDGYVVGFKIKFLLVSLVLFAGCGLLLALRAGTDLNRKIMAAALLLTAAYMLCSGFPFYDRLASVSWSFIPIVWGLVGIALLNAMARRPASLGPALAASRLYPGRPEKRRRSFESTVMPPRSLRHR